MFLPRKARRPSAISWRVRQPFYRTIPNDDAGERGGRPPPQGRLTDAGPRIAGERRRTMIGIELVDDRGRLWSLHAEIEDC